MKKRQGALDFIICISVLSFLVLLLLIEIFNVITGIANAHRQEHAEKYKLKFENCYLIRNTIKKGKNYGK